MDNRQIPFVDPSIDNNEIEAVISVMKTKRLVEGVRTHSFEEKFAKFVGTKYAIACTNGTTALHLAMESSPIQPGDEIITTPFTFIATTNSIFFIGAIPKFVDIDTNTWNLDPEKIEDAITPKTKAIMPVHIFGLAADMKAIRDIAEDHDLYLIEDAAQAHGATIDGKHVGGFGDVAAFSLYATKNLISGEGGVITTNNDEINDKIVSIKNHGRTAKGGYKHVSIGYNARMSDLIGAIADVQIDKLPELLKERAKNAEYYRKIIDEIDGLEYQKIPKGFGHGNYIFALDVRNHTIKPDEAIKKLKERNILARPIYSKLSYQQESMHNLSSWRWSKFVNYPNYSTIDLPIAQSIAINHFEIPVVPSITDEEREHIGNTIIEIFKK